MELDAKAKARILALSEEMDAIHSANKLYWEHANQTLAARADYNFRNERLEKIRAELDQIQVRSS
jgi:hypothetical protein